MKIKRTINCKAVIGGTLVASLGIQSQFASSTEQDHTNQQTPNPPAITTTVPEGYDDLLAPQQTLLDIYFNGRRVGASMATYTQEQVVFEQPQEVLALLKGLSEPEKALEVLILPLDTHQSFVCFYQGQPDCGVLSPETLALIFDEGQLKVDIFVNPGWLEKSPLALDKYLPASTSGASMIHAMSLVATGGDTREEVYTARLNSLFSYDNYRLMMGIESDETNDTRLDQFSLIYEFQDMAYQLGTFRTTTQNASFFNQQDFIGLRVQSTLASRTDLEQVSGTRLFVFLNERSRIEVYKDGQIIDTRIYQPGNIELDTREFPEGAYNVELKIIGDSGRERQESHFFSKSLQLPPTDESLFYIELGYPEDDAQAEYPEAKDEHLGRLGYINRPADFFGWSASYVNHPQQQSFELGSFWLANQFEIQTSHFYTEEREKGNYYAINFRHPNFFASATYRKGKGQTVDGEEPEFQYISDDFKQTSLNIGVPLASSMLNLFARETENEGQEDYRAVGLSWRKNILRSNKFLIDWHIEASKENQDKRLLTGLTLRFTNNRTSFDSSFKYHKQKTALVENSHIDKAFRISQQNPDSDWGVLSHSLELNQTVERESATIQSNIDNEYGSSQLIAEYIDASKSTIESETSQNGKSKNYSVTSRFNLVSSGSEIAFGGERQSTSGVMLDLTSIEQPELSFAVIINDIERTRIKAGNSTFVALEPYQSYQVILTPIGDTLVQFDNSPRQFTLYPGNVKNYAWQISPVKVVIMQILNFNEPFTNAKLQDPENYARTDDLGWVQFEVSSAGEYVFKAMDGQTCVVALSENELKENANYLGKRHCGN